MPAGDAVLLGRRTSGAGTTIVERVPPPGPSAGNIFEGQADATVGSPAPITVNAVLVGWNNASSGHGVVGNAPMGFGIFGMGDSGVVGNGITTGAFGSGSTTGVFGVAAAPAVVGSGGSVVGGTGVAGTGSVGVYGSSSDAFGVVGASGGGTGIAGFSDAATGVAGRSNSGPGLAGTSAAGNGVMGEAQNDGTGVMGQSAQGPGVYGLSDDWHGVVGFSSMRGGVLGVTNSSIFGVDAGVAGVATAAGMGVRGQSSSGPGVYASSDENVAVHGYAPNKIAVYGEGGQAAFYGVTQQGFGVAASSQNGIGIAASSQTSIGLFARTGTRTGTAAVFEGNVVIAGDLTVTGAKHAAVPRAGGGHQLLYCIESPESWLEDFGEAHLVKGRAQVAIDRGFAQTIDVRSYHVFVSAYGAEHVFVSKRSRNGFEIRAVPCEGAQMPRSLRCSYRIVARRRSIKAPRLKRMQLPPIPVMLPALDTKPSQLSSADVGRTLGKLGAARKGKRRVKAALTQIPAKPPRFPRLPKALMAGAKPRARRKSAR